MNTWKLTSLDLFSLGMTIKGAWVYRQMPSFEVLDASLRGLLKSYPQLLGCYNSRTKSVEWDDESSDIRFVKGECRGHSISESPYALVPKYDIKGFKKGRVPAFSACYLTLDDGVALVVQCAHATMDGHSFYQFVRQWAALSKGETITPMVSDQSLIPSPSAIAKEVVLQRVKELHWEKLTLGKLFKMLLNLGAMATIKDTFVIEVPQDEINRLCSESGSGCNAVLCSIAAKRLLEKLPAQDAYTLLQVADLRGRACGVPEDFIGNFSQPVVVGSFGTDTPLLKFQQYVAEALNPDKVTEMVQLSLSSGYYSLPYFPFNPGDMNSRKPHLFYVNNQLKFKANEIDFGCGLPVRVHQAELPDMIKFWQPTQGGPVQIIYGGFAAKIMKR